MEPIGLVYSLAVTKLFIVAGINFIMHYYYKFPAFFFSKFHLNFVEPSYGNDGESQ